MSDFSKAHRVGGPPTLYMRQGGFDQNQRFIHVNTEQTNDFCSNKISTGKYTIWTFLPKFLLEQFRRYINLFFLFVAACQQIPGVSPTGRFTIIIPLTFILLVSAIKEVFEDLKRHTTDRKTNNSTTLVFRGNKWHETLWMHVKVGDIVEVQNNQGIPADLLLLSSSLRNGTCFIETSNIDGETNLKLKQGLPITSHLSDSAHLSRLRFNIFCGAPLRDLDKFVGTLWLSDNTSYPIEPNQILLRGSSLKNTEWIYGTVLYTGHETKVMLNSNVAPLKRSSIDVQINKYIIYLFGVLSFLIIFTTLGNLAWTAYYGGSLWYLGDTSVTFRSLGYMTLTAFILYHTLIPISLPVTLDVVRFIQAHFISLDRGMYDEESNSPAIARTSNLNEDLGQVRRIFSDKTGTLTKNIMQFKRCSIGHRAFGIGHADASVFDDLGLEEQIAKRNAAVDFFFTTLALCHTVIPELTGDRTNYSALRYMASSPDEKALVEASRRLGYVFMERDADSVTLNVQGDLVVFKILNVLEFSSSRKRMSVIVRDPEERILLLVKGADSVIYERLSSRSAYTKETLEHLRSFARAGLRTLCIAYAEIDQGIYEDWRMRHHLASTTLIDREKALAAMADEIEQNLMLMGVTAIEDKLQDEVPETIAYLQAAGISIWLLTGDKQETSVNIGYSCNLLTPNQINFTFDSTSLEDTCDQLERASNDPSGKAKAIIVDANTLDILLSPPCVEQFYKLCTMCTAVICCRVSPWQKSAVVQFVRSKSKEVTLAIGDGANDVGMIQAAHIGVGIIGKEGMQAVSASDFAIGQFRFLKRLLFVHGVWDYSRITDVVLYCFYKSCCLYLILFWFNWWTGFSGTILFERWTIAIYNVAFTAAPPLAMGIFDRIYPEDKCLSSPAVYYRAHRLHSFNLRVFLFCLLDGTFHSLILFAVSALAFRYEVVYPNGRTGSLLVLDKAVYTYVVVIVCLKAGLQYTAWTVFSHLAVWGSIALWFLFLAVYSHVYPTLPVASDMVGLDSAVLGCPTFWLCLLLLPPATLAVDLALKALRSRALPSHFSQPNFVGIEFGQADSSEFNARPPSIRPPTGYAFSQDDNPRLHQSEMFGVPSI
ncbi:Phospholipid-transporting ATPase IA [Sparganum proliferum]